MVKTVAFYGMLPSGPPWGLVGSAHHICSDTNSHGYQKTQTFKGLMPLGANTTFSFYQWWRRGQGSVRGSPKSVRRNGSGSELFTLTCSRLVCFVFVKPTVKFRIYHRHVFKSVNLFGVVKELVNSSLYMTVLSLYGTFLFFLNMGPTVLKTFFTSSSMLFRYPW